MPARFLLSLAFLLGAATVGWTEVVMREAGRMIEGLDLHHYTIVGSWADKGPATAFTETQWFRAMRSALAVDEIITRDAAITDKYDAEWMGLSLAISRDLARGMEGDLRVRSTVGEGSAFTIVLRGA